MGNSGKPERRFYEVTELASSRCKRERHRHKVEPYGTGPFPVFLSSPLMAWFEFPASTQLDGTHVLPVVEGLVEQVAGVEFGVRSGGNEPALVENENHRSVADGAEAMCDDQHRRSG